VRRRLRTVVNAGCLALLGTSVGCPSCPAAEPISVAPGMRGPEIMLYISQPIGPSSAARSFGLRIDRHSVPALLPGTSTNLSDLSGRKQLVNLRMAAHQSVRLDLGTRVSWDFGTHRFAAPGDPPVLRTQFQAPRGARPASLALP